MRNPAFSICENKGADQLCSYRTINMRLWFRYIDIKINKYTKFEPDIPSGSRVMGIFTKRARPAKMMLGEASYKYTKFEQNMQCSTRDMNIFTKRAQSARMMHDEASSPFFIPVAGQW